MKCSVKVISMVSSVVFCYFTGVRIYRNIRLSEMLDQVAIADYVVCPQSKQHIIVLSPIMKTNMQNVMRKGTKVLLCDKKSAFYGDIIFKRNDGKEVLRISIMSYPHSYFDGIPVEVDYNLVDLLGVNLHAYQEENKHRMP